MECCQGRSLPWGKPELPGSRGTSLEQTEFGKDRGQPARGKTGGVGGWSGEPESSSATHQQGDLGLLGLQCLKYTAQTHPWHTVAGSYDGEHGRYQPRRAPELPVPFKWKGEPVTPLLVFCYPEE